MSLALAERRVMSAVNYAEVIVGPSKRGITFVQRVDVMFQRFGIQVIAVDQVMARAAAQIRARTRLGLPDAFVLAVASREGVDGTEVRIESFDERLLMVAASE